MAIQNNIEELLQGHELIPVVTFQEGDDAVGFMEYLVQQNIKCIEITLRTSAGMKAIELLKKEMSDKVLIGAGTVISTEQIDQLKAIDADFMVSPGLTPKLQEAMHNSGIPYLPGTATPSEIMKAMEMGLNVLKFFPANLFGGINALSAYANIFPSIKFCPTGGINEKTTKEYLELSNVFAVGGSWFQKNYNQI